MTGSLTSTTAGHRPRRALRALAAATFCVVVSTAPGKAQFDFLFGKPSPAPAAPQSSEPAKTPKHKAAKQKKPKKTTAAKPSVDAKANAPAPEAEPPPPPYDPEMLRLAEILGALTYLNGLCGSNPSVDWRAKMQALLETDAKTEARKERLAGSYNRGFRDYERTYHSCTQNAQLVISRFLAEGGKIAHDVVNRYGSS
ncbi:MAG TPA: TIGR02301 family protein [Methylocella sp.]|nr:TIGR02301 family protein [Methylocella sp.]